MMKRTSTTAGFCNSISKTPRYYPSDRTFHAWTGPFRFFDLPAEVRNMIYHAVFTASASDVNPTKQNTTLRLTYTSQCDSAVRILKGKPNRINILRPTNFASFALASMRTYNETLPVIACHTSLHLSGADYSFFRDNLHQLPFLGGLIEEVARYTQHVAVEATILSNSEMLRNHLVAKSVFPCLRRVTLHVCGPAEVMFNSPMFALGADDAEHLLSKKSWPSRDLQLVAGSILDPAGVIYWIEGPLGETPLLSVLEDLRSRLTDAQASGSGSETRVTEIEVALKLPLKETVMSAAKTSNVQFDISVSLTYLTLSFVLVPILISL